VSLTAYKKVFALTCICSAGRGLRCRIPGPSRAACCRLDSSSEDEAVNSPKDEWESTNPTIAATLLGLGNSLLDEDAAMQAAARASKHRDKLAGIASLAARHASGTLAVGWWW